MVRPGRAIDVATTHAMNVAPRVASVTFAAASGRSSTEIGGAARAAASSGQSSKEIGGAAHAARHVTKANAAAEARGRKAADWQETSRPRGRGHIPPAPQHARLDFPALLDASEKFGSACARHRRRAARMYGSLFGRRRWATQVVCVQVPTRLASSLILGASLPWHLVVRPLEHLGFWCVARVHQCGFGQ
eukprot:1344120-Amphidinium_carterae.2